MSSVLTGSRAPASHALAKLPGESLQASWGVINFGTASGNANMQLFLMSEESPEGVVTDVGQAVAAATTATVQPEKTVNFSIPWTVPFRPSFTIFFMELRLVEPGVGLIGNHPFTVVFGPFTF